MTNNRNKETKVSVGNHTWKIEVSENEVAFYYERELPYSMWDDYRSPPKYSHSWIENENLTDVSPIAVMNAIMRGVVSLVKNTNYFYFKANNIDRWRVYDPACRRLKRILGDGWKYSFAEGWYFFMRDHAGAC